MKLTREYLHKVLDEFLDARETPGELTHDSLCTLRYDLEEWEKYLRGLADLEKRYPKVFALQGERARWCCDGDGKGGHHAKCRYSRDGYATNAPPSADRAL